jgi:hypothetical protein
MGEWVFELVAWTGVIRRFVHSIDDARVWGEVQVKAFGPPLADRTFGFGVA